MTPPSPTSALADAVAALVEHDDVAHVLSRLLSSCAEVLDVSAVAILVRDGAGRLELLSSTSHRVAELELYQVQRDAGPCIDCIETGAAVSAVSPAVITTTWPALGIRIVDAGFQAVHAIPMHWRGDALGGLNIFDEHAGPLGDERSLLAQAFADIATVVVVSSGHVRLVEATAGIRKALEGRTVIERAKGVLAYTRGVDMATAYDLLVELAADSGATLSDAADDVVRQAQQRR